MLKHVGFYKAGRRNNKSNAHENTTACCKRRFQTDNLRITSRFCHSMSNVFFFFFWGGGWTFCCYIFFCLCAAAIIKFQLKLVCLTTIYKPSLPCNYSCTLDKFLETSGWKKTGRIIHCRSTNSKFFECFEATSRSCSPLFSRTNGVIFGTQH